MELIKISIGPVKTPPERDICPGLELDKMVNTSPTTDTTLEFQRSGLKQFSYLGPPIDS